jgi:arylsulfatase
MTLYVDDEQVDQASMRVMAVQFSLCGEGLTVGYDGGDRVSTDYPHRFELTGGEIAQVVFDVSDDTYVDVETHMAALVARD